MWESKEQTIARAKTRWRETDPSLSLTWGRQVTGDAFITKAVSYQVFGLDRAILEIGPGYGRLLKSMLEQGVPFSDYLGLDLSPKNVEHLRRTFSSPKIGFVNGDAETFTCDKKYDVVLSSLTLKHLYPTFEKALQNVAGQMNPSGSAVFDLIEGDRRHFFEDDNVTYVRPYTRQEVQEIAQQAGLQVVAFDKVDHDADYSRLFVVCKKAEDIREHTRSPIG